MLHLYMGDMVLVGVTQENVDRLMAGMPLEVKLLEAVKRVVIWYGVDKPAILDELEKQGLEIPAYLRDTAKREPD